MEEQTRTPEKLTKALQSIHVLRLDQKRSKMESVGDIYKKGNHKYNTINQIHSFWSCQQEYPLVSLPLIT